MRTRRQGTGRRGRWIRAPRCDTVTYLAGEALRLGAEERSVKLVQIAPFRLGEVLVDPPTRRIVNGEKFEILEPRIMQVLVVLALARGSVVSRDELIGAAGVAGLSARMDPSAIARIALRCRQDRTASLEPSQVGYRILPAGLTTCRNPHRPRRIVALAPTRTASLAEPHKICQCRLPWCGSLATAGSLLGGPVRLAAGRPIGRQPKRSTVRRAQSPSAGHPDQVIRPILLSEATRIDPQLLSCGDLPYFRQIRRGLPRTRDSLPVDRSAAQRALSIDL